MAHLDCVVERVLLHNCTAWSVAGGPLELRDCLSARTRVRCARRTGAKLGGSPRRPKPSAGC
eukprot:14973043-Alexandrium_andersonii.AAC.1